MILSLYADEVDAMDMNVIVNEFITRGDSKRRNAFALRWLWVIDANNFCWSWSLLKKSWDCAVLFSKVFRTNSFTRNHLSRFQNALKLTWGKVEKQKILRVIPPDPRFKGRGRRGGWGDYAIPISICFRRPWQYAWRCFICGARKQYYSPIMLPETMCLRAKNKYTTLRQHRLSRE